MSTLLLEYDFFIIFSYFQQSVPIGSKFSGPTTLPWKFDTIILTRFKFVFFFKTISDLKGLKGQLRLWSPQTLVDASKQTINNKYDKIIITRLLYNI